MMVSAQQWLRLSAQVSHSIPGTKDAGCGCLWQNCRAEQERPKKQTKRKRLQSESNQPLVTGDTSHSSIIKRSRSSVVCSVGCNGRVASTLYRAKATEQGHSHRVTTPASVTLDVWKKMLTSGKKKTIGAVISVGACPRSWLSSLCRGEELLTGVAERSELNSPNMCSSRGRDCAIV